MKINRNEVKTVNYTMELTREELIAIRIALYLCPTSEITDNKRKIIQRIYEESYHEDLKNY